MEETKKAMEVFIQLIPSASLHILFSQYRSSSVSISFSVTNINGMPEREKDAF